MATFKRKKIDKIVWQPRIEHWYNVRKVKETLPEKYKNKEILEIYDDLGASVRYYYGSTMDISSPKTYIRFEYAKGAKVKEIRKNYDIHMIYETPIGSAVLFKDFCWNIWGLKILYMHSMIIPRE